MTTNRDDEKTHAAASGTPERQSFARRFFATPERRSLVAAAVLAALVGAGLGAAGLSGDTVIDLALGTHTAESLDDAAGDAMPSRNAYRYLPVPSTLEDERVIAAMGPLVDLACHKSDYDAAIAKDAPPAPVPDLGSDDIDPSQYAWIDRAATTAGVAPITAPPRAQVASADNLPTLAEIARDSALSAPLSASESEIDALLSRNLLSAALSPIAALPAPPASQGGDAASTGECPAILRHSFSRLQTGELQTLCQFRGKVLLIVNTASYCGYTKQYEGLESMYRTYKDRGLVVVGFPSNDFGGQEPGSNKEIAEFCRTTYGVQFPMFEKSSVARLDSNPLYVDLAKATGSAPKWNFHKYVVDRTGTRIASFASDVTPESRSLVQLIERLLAERPPIDKG